MKVAVLVSGGVDSAVALDQVKKQGHEVTAFYLKIWLEDELAYLGDCPWQEDLSYVRAVCDQLNVPLEVISLQQEYHDQVVAYTLEEIKAGRTPNPDIMCNARIKFGSFLSVLEARGEHFDKIASGHYAQVAEYTGRWFLTRCPDPVKDQTYFLAGLSQEQLSRVMFPIGHLHKYEVRALAEAANLPNKHRKDSQGICFLGKFKFTDFLRHHLGEKTGALIEWESGTQLAEHRGFWFYTIGQRQGIGLSGGPWYVVAKDTNKNHVYISRAYYAADKKRSTFVATDMNWFAGTAPEKTTVGVKVRHGQDIHAARIVERSDGSLDVTLTERDQGLASGQFAVLYDGQCCLGAGRIVV